VTVDPFTLGPPSLGLLAAVPAVRPAPGAPLVERASAVLRSMPCVLASVTETGPTAVRIVGLAGGDANRGTVTRNLALQAGAGSFDVGGLTEAPPAFCAVIRELPERVAPARAGGGATLAPAEPAAGGPASLTVRLPAAVDEVPVMVLRADGTALAVVAPAAGRAPGDALAVTLPAAATASPGPLLVIALTASGPLRFPALAAGGNRTPEEVASWIAHLRTQFPGFAAHVATAVVR
jgi:hypothetical protein